ncbi:acylphosphatase, putative [Plasmodium reichenowi]|uniref:acylphosphatase n=1 Tax=Plasmodium reichenowi TaxID=5854 RepID=A0A060RZI1_PLARE|nr:acylphosphatase, putative [Plasmodium reichenowi]KYN96444.1 acylphosphatase, putative [Plasmodium reichenowi]CDO64920.1 acylphosphatase, putative [Plasmodium reichenowi]SOV80046.1 acylphosphatase, putative [Plasmodium reichenowi]
MRFSHIFHSFLLFPQTKYISNRNFLLKNFSSSNKMIHTFDFEVFGKVQGVFFRKYTKLEADKLNIKGYVQNTNVNTVIGRAESDNKETLEKFKNFLTNIGSPSSKINKCVISNEKVMDNYCSPDFTIKR